MSAAFKPAPFPTDAGETIREPGKCCSPEKPAYQALEAARAVVGRVQHLSPNDRIRVLRTVCAFFDMRVESKL